MPRPNRPHPPALSRRRPPLRGYRFHGNQAFPTAREGCCRSSLPLAASRCTHLLQSHADARASRRGSSRVLSFPVGEGGPTRSGGTDGARRRRGPRSGHRAPPSRQDLHCFGFAERASRAPHPSRLRRATFPYREGESSAFSSSTSTTPLVRDREWRRTMCESAGPCGEGSGVGVVQDLLDGVARLQQPLGPVYEEQHCPPTPIRRLRRHLPHEGEGRPASTR